LFFSIVWRWLISAACPTPQTPALGFHTDALLFRLLIALLGARDLLLCAKHLFVAAKVAVPLGTAAADRFNHATKVE
jgi:hypothetical protein